MLKRFAHRPLPLLAAAFCCSLLGGLAGTVNAAPTRLIIWSRAGAPSADLQDAVAPTRAQVRRVGGSNLHITELPPGVSATSLRDRLRRHPHVRHVEEDRLLKPGVATTDPYGGSLWHLDTIGATAAWNLSTGKGITIAIVDTGVDPRHPDLMPNLVPGFNVVDQNTDTTDLAGHGTAVAGVAAAAVNNGLGVAGLAGQSRIMPIRVAGANGSARMSDIAKGIVYAADQGVRVVNVSYAGMTESFVGVAAAQYLKSKGGLLFVAAGNNGIEESFQATRDMIPVAATNSSDQRPTWASWGAHVALTAPGEGIWSTAVGGGYAAVSGSSFSSPLAAGLAALMLAAHPKASSADIEAWLTGTAKDLGAPGRDAQFGVGRINASAAVATAVAAAGLVPSAGSTTTDGNSQIAPSGAINTATNVNASIDISVVSVDPSVSGSSNAGAPTPSAGVWQVRVTLAAPKGVARVDLRANGLLVGSDTASPYEFVLNPSAFPRGAVQMTAEAFDAAGMVLAVATVDRIWSDTVGSQTQSGVPTTAASQPDRTTGWRSSRSGVGNQ